MALRVGLEYDQPLGGIFCYSGFYSSFTKPSIFNQGTPIFIQHGKADPSFDYEKVEESYKNIDNSRRRYYKLVLVPDLKHDMMSVLGV